MEKIINSINEDFTIFNSPLETGLRSLIILDEAYPHEYDITTLIWLDHLVVHTGDFGGPISLHPNISSRSGELLVRRTIIEEGLVLMRKIHLIKIDEISEGIFYTTTDYARPVIDLLYEKYTNELKDRAKWLINMIDKLAEGELKKLVDNRMGLWNIEFQLSERNKYEQ